MKTKQTDWSGIIVKRLVGWEDGPEGRAVLLVPRFRSKFLTKWLMPRLKKPHVRVKLDEVGSFAWRKMDNGAGFVDLCLAMKEGLGPKAEPVEDRLKKFLLILQRNKFVELLVLQNCHSDPFA